MDLLRRFFRPRVAIGAVVVAVAAGTAALWSVIGWVALLVFMILLMVGLVVVIVMLWRRYQAERATEEIERTITRQADQDIERSVAAKVDEAKDMKAQLLEAIQDLRQRVGRGGFSTIPWYLVMGPTDAGKSTLVLRSELRFSGDDETRGVRPVAGIGGTRRFDWWLSQDAVVLDMAGRALGTSAQFEDNEDWIAFLRTLARQRRGKPINGVLLVVGVEQLAGHPTTELDKLAGRVRERLQELVHHLGVVFPVYAVVTQMDRLVGFSEFFADLGDPERGQIWGATLKYRQRSAEEVEQEFDREFQALAGVLGERRLRRVAALSGDAARARAFGFPLQLERLRDPMIRFVGGVFQPDPSGDSPVFRGVYFTSAAQEGAPIDLVAAPALAAVGGAPAGGAKPATSGTFFVRDLFSRVLSGEAGLAGLARAEKARQRLRRVIIAGSLAASFVLVAVLLSSFSCANRRVIDRTRDAARRVAQTVKVQSPLDANLESLDGLRARLVVLDSLAEGRPTWRKMGAYSGDAVIDPALKLYTQAALAAVIRPAADRMVDSLSAQTATGAGAFIDYFELFRAVRLLHNADKLVADDAPTLARVMRRMLASQIATGPDEDRRRKRSLLDAQIEFLATHPYWLSSLGPKALGPENLELVARASTRVRDTWDPSQFYRRMIREIEPTIPEASLPGLMGKATLVTDAVVVGGPFTRSGWNDRVRPELARRGERMRNDWIVREVFAGGGTPAGLEAEMATRYARDYTAHWVALLDGIEIDMRSDLNGAVEMMAKLKEPDSPIVLGLKAVAEQTTLGVDPALALGQVDKDFALLHQFVSSGGAGSQGSLFQRVAQRFGAGGSAGGASGAGQSASALYLQELGKVQEQVTAAAQSGSPVLKQAILCVGAGTAESAVCRSLQWVDFVAGDFGGAKGTEPVARVLRLPMKKCQESVRGSPTKVGGFGPPIPPTPEMAAAWSGLVGQFQSTLAGRYPLSPGRSAEATLQDFAGFFKPGGAFWSFHQQYLKDYVNEDGTPTPAAQAGVPFTGGLPGVVRRAYEIREALFSVKPDTPWLEFTISTGTPSVEGPPINPRKVFLDLGGQSAVYFMGPKRPMHLEWPGPDPAVGASLRAETDQAQPQALRAPGPWGLFRLLDMGALSGGSEPQVTWQLIAGQSRIRISYDIRPGSARHPFRRGSLSFSLPGSL